MGASGEKTWARCIGPDFRRKAGKSLYDSPVNRAKTRNAQLGCAFLVSG